MSLVLQWSRFTRHLETAGAWLAPLGLRVVLAWEFWEAGMEKWRGENWFASVAERFPFPFDALPVDLSWAIATWAELLGAVALLLGLATRFTALSLSILTVVAIAAVHWPAEWSSLSDLLRGYAITDKGFGNYKLPLIFLLMLWPLLFNGAGRLSIDAWLARLGSTRAAAYHRAPN